MGCFNVSCGVSGISMYGDRAVLFPLIPYHYIKDGIIRLDTGAFIASNEGCNTTYENLTLPIFGNMNSYGSLENIEKDDNVECIEKAFGMNIVDFAESVSTPFDDRAGELKLDKIGTIKNVAGMYVHRDIYDVMIKTEVGESGKDEWSILGGFCGELSTYVLGLIGFKQDSVLDGERYKYVMKNAEFPEVVIYTDGDFIKLEISGKIYESVYTLGKIIEEIENNTDKRFGDDVKLILENNHRHLVLLDETLDEYLDDLKNLEESLFNFKNEYLYSKLSLTNNFNKNGRKIFDALYIEKLKNKKTSYDIKKAYADLQSFKHNLFSVNKMFGPTFNGYQHGNHFAHKLVAEKTLEILNEKIKE